LSRELGNEAELKAADALVAAGYNIIDRNYNTRVGEIDIIASKDNFICFIEVKYRNPRGFGTAIDAITKSKMRKILQTAKTYLYEIGRPDTDYRIDAVVMDRNDIEIIQNIYVEGL